MEKVLRKFRTNFDRGEGEGIIRWRRKGFSFSFREIRGEEKEKIEFEGLREKRKEDIKKGRETWEETGRKWEREKNILSPI